MAKKSMFAQSSDRAGESGLMTAIEHLKAEHPINQAAMGTAELGPHQGTHHHNRHVPMHGMSPTVEWPVATKVRSLDESGR
jgi:hypothetical protein